MINPNDLIHLSPSEIQTIHDDILFEGNGLVGSRPDLPSCNLTNRLQQRFCYQHFNTLAEIAALYAEVIARGHVFLDGNKRTALTSMLSFLNLNDLELKVNQSELENQIVDIADKKIDFKQFAIWLTPHLHSKNE